MPTKKKITYSIIVLLEKQHEDFPRFMKNIYDVFSLRQVPFEILIVANGTGGFLRNQFPNLGGFANVVRAYELNTRTSQAVCLRAALNESRGKIIVVCGSYQEITNESLVKLLDSLDGETDITNPWRQTRLDHWFKQFQSKLFNAVVRKIIRHDLHDLSCMVRAFRREVLEETEIYGNMYRFLPILAAQKGFKTKEVRCQHCPEPDRVLFFRLSDYFTRVVDILTLYFNTMFAKKPLRFFSSIGLTFLLTGLFMTAYVFAQKIFMEYPMGRRPILLLSIFFMVLGVQVASVGLLGEIIAFTHGRHKKEYTIEKAI
ncbi:MAG: hypothetical protein GTN81_06455 [Proteobacteria bacterium]|nr:hypothetical protein [Pseudomonadota bacterium]